jgi:hypothetical protein
VKKANSSRKARQINKQVSLLKCVKNAGAEEGLPVRLLIWTASCSQGLKESLAKKRSIKGASVTAEWIQSVILP